LDVVVVVVVVVGGGVVVVVVVVVGTGVVVVVDVVGGGGSGMFTSVMSCPEIGVTPISHGSFHSVGSLPFSSGCP